MQGMLIFTSWLIQISSRHFCNDCSPTILAKVLLEVSLLGPYFNMRFLIRLKLDMDLFIHCKACNIAISISCYLAEADAQHLFLIGLQPRHLTQALLGGLIVGVIKWG